MDTESRDQGETGRPPKALGEARIREWQRFIGAANDEAPTKPTVPRRTRGLSALSATLLIVALIALVCLMVWRLGEQDAAYAADASRLREAICRATMRLGARNPDQLQTLCGSPR